MRSVFRIFAAFIICIALAACGSSSPVTASGSGGSGGPISGNAIQVLSNRADLINGGELTGTYSLGDFNNCGINQWLINAVIPGSGNTVDINVSNGQFVS